MAAEDLDMDNLAARQESYPNASDLTWSRSEKTAARTVFDAALKRELHEVMREAKRMAEGIKEPADLW